MRKKIAATGVALALAGGGAGLALVGPSIASAADPSSSTADPAATHGRRPDPKARLTEVLKPLVDAGTITQAQADAVIDALEQARPEGMGPGGRGPGGRGPGGRGPGRRGPGLDTAATALGIDVAALRTELQAGKTIADVADDRGVDVQSVIDAIVADMQDHLADAVESGRLTQAEADERTGDAEERATAVVNGEFPNRPAAEGSTTG